MKLINTFVINEGTKLFVTLYPNPDKESVILLHGGPGLPDSMPAIMEHLSEKYNVILFHQRGTLKSPCLNNDYSLEKYISDIVSIARHFNLPTFHLLGHSWGGLYAQIFAAKHQNLVLSLFIISPAPGTGKQWKEGMSEVTAYHKSMSSAIELVEMAIAATLGVFGMDEGYQKLFARMAINFNKRFKTSEVSSFEISCVKAKPILPTSKAILKYPLLEPIASPNIKITVLFGDDDIIAKSRKYIYERLPKAIFHVVPQSGHLPWLHNPEVFFTILNGHYNLNH